MKQEYGGELGVRGLAQVAILFELRCLRVRCVWRWSSCTWQGVFGHHSVFSNETTCCLLGCFSLVGVSVWQRVVLSQSQFHWIAQTTQYPWQWYVNSVVRKARALRTFRVAIMPPTNIETMMALTFSAPIVPRIFGHCSCRTRVLRPPTSALVGPSEDVDCSGWQKESDSQSGLLCGVHGNHDEWEQHCRAALPPITPCCLPLSHFLVLRFTVSSLQSVAG